MAAMLSTFQTQLLDATLQLSLDQINIQVPICIRKFGRFIFNNPFF